MHALFQTGALKGHKIFSNYRRFPNDTSSELLNHTLNLLTFVRDGFNSYLTNQFPLLEDYMKQTYMRFIAQIAYV